MAAAAAAIAAAAAVVRGRGDVLLDYTTADDVGTSFGKRVVAIKKAFAGIPSWFKPPFNNNI